MIQTLVNSSTGLLSTFISAMSTRTSSICGYVWGSITTQGSTCWQACTDFEMSNMLFGFIARWKILATSCLSSNFVSTSTLFAGWKGFMNEVFCSRLYASAISACCPIELHIIIFASWVVWDDLFLVLLCHLLLWSRRHNICSIRTSSGCNCWNWDMHHRRLLL